MSRREPRASLGARQNDALYEFETFKKKFLLANKHITKLNSTLSVRIEELNAQLHALNVENLRLRTSGIQLASELKREREKSRKIMADAETATLSLTRHLNYLRTTLDVPRSPPTPLTPSSPKARHRPPPPDPNVESLSPQGMKIARPPNVPGIIPEDEEPISSSEAGDEQKLPTPPKRKSKIQPRLSASNLPLSVNRISTPPPIPLSSEPNNVLHVDLSVAVASSRFSKRKPMRRQSGLLTVSAENVARPASPAFGSPVRLQAAWAGETVVGKKSQIEVEEEDVGNLERKDSRLRTTTREQAIPVPPAKDRKRRREDDDSHIVTVEAVTTKLKHQVTSGRTALQPIDNTIYDQHDDMISHNAKQFFSVHQRDSLSPIPVMPFTSEVEAEGSADAGRERRARKSVNYAEPKLNTKMRRPDLGSGPEPRKKRSSAAARSGTREGSEIPDPDPQSTSEQLQPLPPRFHVESPPPRPDYPSPSRSSTMAKLSGVTTSRRKKSQQRAYHIDDEDEESDGADVDEEYAPPGGKKLWSNINTDGRKKMSGQKGAGESESRRHSMAV